MTSNTTPTLRLLLQDTPLSTLTKSPKFTRNIVSIKSNETFYDALYLMNRYNILSLCCMEEKKIAHTNEIESTILGFLSNLDILFYISEALILFEFDGLSPESITLKQCLNRSIKDIMYQKLETEHYHMVKESETVLDLITDKFAKGVHRTIVMKDSDPSSVSSFGGEGELIGMISQSDIIKFAEDYEWYDESFDPQVFLNLHWKDRDLISMSEEDTLSEALQQMSTHSLSAVAIVRKENSAENSNKSILVGNFSASDLRRITQDFSEDQAKGSSLTLSQYFNMKILDYLTKYSKSSLNPITINSSDKSLTMRSLVNLFAKCKIHRVWIVDNDQVPQGVITLTDLCQFVANRK